MHGVCIIGNQSMYSRCQLYRTKEGWYIVCLLQMFNNYCIIILYNFICPRLVSLSNYMKGHSKSIVHIVYCGIWLGRTKNCMLCIGRSHQALKEVVEHLQIPIGKYSVSDGIENSLSWGLHDTVLKLVLHLLIVIIIIRRRSRRGRITVIIQ